MTDTAVASIARRWTDRALRRLALIALAAGLMACSPSPDDALSKRAKAGDPVAQHELALAFFKLQQYDKAARWWTQAAEQGDADAQAHLGLMYQAGIGFAQDFATARRWYLAAAEQGEPDSQSSLAWLYRHGEGGERDSEQALQWYREAAQQGSVTAMTELGEMLAAGEGLPQDQDQALSWWRQAATQGYSGGWVRLAEAYAQGNGVPRDGGMAYAMLERARNAGPEGMAVHWYEQIDKQEDDLTFTFGYFAVTERAKQLESEGKVDAVLAGPMPETASGAQ